MPIVNASAARPTAAIIALLAGVGCTTAPPAGDAFLAAADAAPVSVGVLPPGGAMAAGRDGVVTREPWEFGSYPGYRITTPSYRVYTTISYERFLSRLPLFLENAMEQYTSALADLPRPTDRLETYVFRDRRQWSAKTRQLLPDQASTFENLGRGGYTTRGISVLYYIDWAGRDRDTFAIASHEGWHQYTQSAFRHPLPVWLEEGIATYMEGYRFRRTEERPIFQPWRNWERSRALGEAMRENELIPLRELLGQSPQSFLGDGKDRLLTYYAQVWALTRFLIEAEDGRYREDLAEVLSDAAHGRLIPRLLHSAAVLAYGGRSEVLTSKTGPWVILAYFSSDLAAFEKEYLEFAATLVR